MYSPSCTTIRARASERVYCSIANVRRQWSCTPAAAADELIRGWLYRVPKFKSNLLSSCRPLTSVPSRGASFGGRYVSTIFNDVLCRGAPSCCRVVQCRAERLSPLMCVRCCCGIPKSQVAVMTKPLSDVEIARGLQRLRDLNPMSYRG